MKKVWIFNHYAGKPPNSNGLRHYNFSKYLNQEGYLTTVFASSAIHNSNVNLIVDNKDYVIDDKDGIPFVYIKTRIYTGNGMKRVTNMLDFYKRLFKVTKKFDKPDVIIASSVHPLTLLAGIKIAKKMKIPCICEIRDLWPESFLAYNIVKRKNPILKMLYFFEKKIYQKADKLIFTMEGGKDYLIDKGWNKEKGGTIDLAKVFHINNGVDLEVFDYNQTHYILDDKDLQNKDYFNVIYTGSIRLVNKVEVIFDVAKILKDKGVKFLVWGDGDRLEDYTKRVAEESIDNICFKGAIDKKYIPFITSKGSVNIIFGESLPLFKYGISMNKLFDYVAAEKPVLATFVTGHSIIDKYKAGFELADNSANAIAEAIMFIKDLDMLEYSSYCKNARKVAVDYDMKELAHQLAGVIDSCF